MSCQLHKVISEQKSNDECHHGSSPRAFHNFFLPFSGCCSFFFSFFPHRLYDCPWCGSHRVLCLFFFFVFVFILVFILCFSVNRLCPGSISWGLCAIEISRIIIIIINLQTLWLREMRCLIF